MGAHRVELTGFSDGAVPQLKALGLTSEIIAWRLRLFVPTAADRGPAILGNTPRPPPAARAPMPVPPPDHEMCRDQRRGRSGAPPRARRRGRVPSLPLQRMSSGRYWVIGDVMNTPAAASMCGLRPDYGPGAAGKWTDAATGEHGDLLDLIRLNRTCPLGEAMDEARCFLALPRCRSSPRIRPAPPAASGSPEAARRLFRAGRPVPGTPAEAYLRARGIAARLDWPALRYHPSVYYRETDHAPLESWPALLAAVTDLGGAITGIQRTWLDPGGRRKRPSPIPAARSAISSATACASDGRRHPRRRRRRRDHAGAQIGAAPIADGGRAFGQPPLRSRSAPGARAALCGARQRCGRPQSGEPVARTRRAAGSTSASSCPFMATSISISAVSAPTACGHISRISSSHPTGRGFARSSPPRSAAVSRVVSVHPASCRKEGTAFVRARRCALGRRKSRAAAFPSGDLPAAEPGCNGAGQRFSAAGLIVQGYEHGGAAISPALHREAK